jgi:hypothetical protein
MKYPNFLPYPRCFGQSIYLLALNIPAIIALFIFSSFYLAYGIALFSGIENKAIVVLTFFVLAFLLAVIVFAYLDFVLFGNHKSDRKKFKFIPPTESLVEGLLMTVFSGISYFMMILLIIPFLPNYNNYISFRDSSYYDNLMVTSWIIWIITAAYCFYLRELFRKDKIQSKD